MEIILLQDIKALGKEGDTVKAKDGYARNYLIPRKLAMACTAGTVRILEAKRKRASKEREKQKQAARALEEKLSQISLTIPVESGMEDKLFGSVTPETIFHALQQEDIHVDKKAIFIKEPIRKLGIYNIEIRLHPEIKVSPRIWVVKK
ncbi:MAG: 50S ribosomal protein L9 [Candidatus Omnitrophota bacterium]|nr:MAG: 50S ribosomal protein L9 [Candidatus Omnitrophota bacterium]